VLYLQTSLAAAVIMDDSQDQKAASGSWLPEIIRNNFNTSKDHKRTPDERSSLLPPIDDDDDDEHTTGEIYSIGHDAKSEVRLVGHEFWVLFKGSVPVILAYTLQNSLQTISVLIVGRLGAEELAVSAFCYSKCSTITLLCGTSGNSR
jgi:MATE family multidrug resistance protein